MYIDRDNGKEKLAEDDDFALRTTIIDGSMESMAGTGDANGYKTTTLDGWQSVVTAAGVGGSNFDTVEYAIPLRLVQAQCGAPFGLAFYHHWVLDEGVDYGWPNNQFFDQPQDVDRDYPDGDQLSLNPTAASVQHSTVRAPFRHLYCSISMTSAMAPY